MRVLTVYAHPDDESFGPAAVLARWVGEGAELGGLWFTRGEHGAPAQHPAPSAAELARLREQDLRAAAQLIGYAGVEILDYADGTLDTLARHELEQHVLERLGSFRPEVVLTFGPGGITRHPDHVAVHRATRAAFFAALAEGLPVRELLYDAVPPAAAARLGIVDEPDGQPNTFVDVASTQHVKLQALEVHARHVADAAERLARLQREPLPVETLFRAYPPDPPAPPTMA
jgi:LmbE family N-acetylglucosaminyl deacetylase